MTKAYERGRVPINSINKYSSSPMARRDYYNTHKYSTSEGASFMTALGVIFLILFLICAAL